MIVRTYTRRLARNTLEDAVFRAGWEALWSKCLWATVFQSPAFSIAWYRVYAGHYDPVIIAGYDAEVLSGLLLLAQPVHGGALVHVGTHHAEYQVWLAKPDTSDVFVPLALEAAAALAPNDKLQLKYVPVGSPLGWLTASISRGICAEVQPVSRGFMELGDGTTVRKALGKSRYRYRLRKLSELGAVRFEHITAVAALEPWLPQIVQFCDFRQGAVNSTLPFSNDALKLPFHLALMAEENLLHTSLLFAGETLISAQINWMNRGEIALGVVSHTPFLAKYSPGTLHLMLCARMAAEQNIRVLDLTPAGEYKERFATGHDTVHKLNIFFGPRRRIASSMNTALRATTKQIIVCTGHNPRGALDALQKRVDRLRRRRLTEVAATPFRLLSKWSWTRRELRFYEFDLQRKVPEDPKHFQRDSIRDLLCIQRGDEQFSSKYEFLATCLSRLEHGNHAYTRVEDGRLVHRGWLKEGHAAAMLSDEELDFASQSGVVTLFDFYTDPPYRRRGYNKAAVRKVLADAAADGYTLATVAVPAGNNAGRHVVETVGFNYIGSYHQNIVLGRVRGWAEFGRCAPRGVRAEGCERRG